MSLSWGCPISVPFGCQDQPLLPHPVLFYRTLKIGKIDELPSACENVSILDQKWGIFMSYVTFSVDKDQTKLVSMNVPPRPFALSCGRTTG
jgi:hypothetical protein